MKHNTSNTEVARKEAGYNIPIDHYAFWRWTANEANREPSVQHSNWAPGLTQTTT